MENSKVEKKNRKKWFLEREDGVAAEPERAEEMGGGGKVASLMVSALLGGASYQPLLLIQPLHLEKANEDLNSEERADEERSHCRGL